MTPLESLLRAAEALRRHWRNRGQDKFPLTKPLYDEFDAALARYRAEPDLDERVRRLEAIDADRGRIVGDSSAHVMRLEARVAKLESGTHGPWSAFAARAVREGQNEQGEAGSTDGRAAQVQSGAQTAESAPHPQHCEPGPAAGPTGAESESLGTASPASPPAFARETPRTIWKAEVGDKSALYEDGGSGYPGRMIASPPPETRTLAEQIDALPRYKPHIVIDDEPAQPPKRETGITRTQIETVLCKAWDMNQQDPRGDFGREAGMILDLVSEHVARVERRAEDYRAKWLKAGEDNEALMDEIGEIVVPGNGEDVPTAVRRLKAECERLRATLDATGADLCAQVNAATARADAAERKLSECEEDNSAWRTEAFEQRVRAQKAEKERDEHANDARMLRSRVERLVTRHHESHECAANRILREVIDECGGAVTVEALTGYIRSLKAPRAPAEGIEKAVEAIWEDLRARAGFWQTTDKIEPDMKQRILSEWVRLLLAFWPSPATPGPIVMPSRTAIVEAACAETMAQPWTASFAERRRLAEATATAALRQIQEANPGRATVRAVTAEDVRAVRASFLAVKDMPGDLDVFEEFWADGLNQRIGFMPKSPAKTLVETAIPPGSNHVAFMSDGTVHCAVDPDAPGMPKFETETPKGNQQ